MTGSLNRRQLLAGLGVTLTSLALTRPAPAAAGPSLTAAAGELALPGGAKPTRTQCFDASIPGPLLRVKRNQALKLRFANHLQAPSTIHWHGVRLANAMDGIPALTQQAVKPGDGFDYTFTPPDAGTFWYHPPAFGPSLTQGAAGLYGVLVVDEDEPPAVDSDLILVIDDWHIGPDGQILPPERAANGKPIITANSKAVETIHLAPNERLRLRLVNAAATRIAKLALAGFGATIIAIDGHPVDTPFAPNHGRIDLPPGGRADIAIDGPLAAGNESGIALDHDGEVVILAHLTASGAAPARPAPLPPLALPRSDLPAALALQKAKRVAVPLPSRAGGNSALPDRPLFSVRRGSLVDLGLANKTRVDQAVHVHGHAMRILHPFDDEWQPYWVDTVAVGPGETVHTVFLADNPGKWLLHSRACGPVREDLVTWFEVI
ncbi:multicopper oxidase family protein [Labrys sp. KNU-23]|uniref:multicopper oxidase family protein n=1 Tax=Labrys sp. KNU-23 TaxID=2789216 RepID=UPI0011EC9B65|nr:multicopper oxidase family protein [Labrys sp. KNU-23]QEN86758.1 multicopper oxidase family protein [Labrys sp. KNU-23]